MSGHEDVSVLVVGGDMVEWEWFYVVRRYETADEALAAFNRMNEHAARLEGRAEIAGYRLLDQLGGEARIVVVIGMKGERVREAARMLEGKPWGMHAEHLKGLVLRRIRFLIAAGAFDLESGVHTFHHGVGMRLDDEGKVVPND